MQQWETFHASQFFLVEATVIHNGKTKRVAKLEHNKHLTTCRSSQTIEMIFFFARHKKKRAIDDNEAEGEKKKCFNSLTSSAALAAIELSRER